MPSSFLSSKSCALAHRWASGNLRACEKVIGAGVSGGMVEGGGTLYLFRKAIALHGSFSAS